MPSLLRYSLLMIDPPWPKKKGGLRSVRAAQGRSLDYATMTVNEVFDLLVKHIFSRTEETHTVFIWTVDEFLWDCEAEMNRLDYRRHARLIWDKTNGVAPAFTVRYSHEYLLWYYKPKMMPVAVDQRGKFRTVFQEQGREHSRKPEAAYQMVKALYPSATKLDVFSRERRPGWNQFGNQLDYFK